MVCAHGVRASGKFRRHQQRQRCNVANAMHSTLPVCDMHRDVTRAMIFRASAEGGWPRRTNERTVDNLYGKKHRMNSTIRRRRSGIEISSRATTASSRSFCCWLESCPKRIWPWLSQTRRGPDSYAGARQGNTLLPDKTNTHDSCLPNNIFVTV